MSQSIDEFKAQYPFTTEIKVYWNDLDSNQHVNNVVYYRYLEQLRVEFLHAAFFDESQVKLGFVLAESSCRYLSSVNYPDTLLLGLYIAHIGDSQNIQHHGIYSYQQQRLVATGTSRLVNVDSETGKKKPMADGLKEALQRYFRSEQQD